MQRPSGEGCIKKRGITLEIGKYKVGERGGGGREEEVLGIAMNIVDEEVWVEEGKSISPVKELTVMEDNTHTKTKKVGSTSKRVEQSGHLESLRGRQGVRVRSLILNLSRREVSEEAIAVVGF